MRALRAEIFIKFENKILQNQFFTNFLKDFVKISREAKSEKNQHPLADKILIESDKIG